MFSSANIKLYNFGELNYVEHEIKTCFNSLKESIEIYEKLFEDKLQALKKSIQEDSYLNSNDDEEFKSQYYSQFYDREESAINTMKNLQRNSILISSIAILESKLVQLCELVFEFSSSKLKYSDIKSKKTFIDGLRIYLEKVIEIEMTKSSIILKELLNDIVLRNIAIHSLGIVNKKEDEKIIKRMEGIFFNEKSNFVHINSRMYLDSLIERIKNFSSNYSKRSI